MRCKIGLLFCLLLSGCASLTRPTPLVLLTDFGTRDGAVAAMKGVAISVDPRLSITDLIHEVTPFDIWEAAYRLQQTYKYWPAGTVFVAVIDPGVGSVRKSLVARSRSGHVFVGPDNGLFSLIGDDVGWAEVRVIDENAYRRRGSEDSYTFHGRDLYSYVGAQIAAGKLKVARLGEPLRAEDMVRLEYQPPRFVDNSIKGTITVLDPAFGNVWTNIPRSLVLNHFREARRFRVRIEHDGKLIFNQTLPLVDTFAGVKVGAPLVYFNSLLNLSVAINQGNFARKYKIGSGPTWSVQITPTK